MAIIIAITFLFCLLTGRFFYIQVVKSDSLKYLAVDQWTREIPVIAQRGAIIDANGVVLAGNTLSYSVFVRARAATDKEGTAKILSALFACDFDALYAKMQSSNVSEITVARQVSKEQILALEEYSLAGVYYARDNTRLYPYGALLSHVIGFTSSDNTGVSGLEKYYDKYLAGEDGELLYETDLVGIDIEDSPITYLPATDGLTIRLTVDYEIQSIAEEVMKRAYEEYAPASAQCIVLDVTNFDVLAMAEIPSYDLNDVPREDTDLLNSLSRNRIVCDIYEPGSTFKVVTAAADIEESLKGNGAAYALNEVFSSSGTRQVDGTTIKCWTSHAGGKHANQTLAEALNNSCNPCFVDIALALGSETFYRYLNLFHFGSLTGIDFSGESLGMVLPCSSVRDCDLARIGFGQTIAVSALQLACATAAAVNGGYYYTPRLVKSIEDGDGNVIEEIEPVLQNRTISGEASAILAGLLEGVVRDGSGKKAYIEGYRVGGKTGTAQKYENGHIAAGKYVSSFVGFFPANDPKYLALVVVDEPQGSYYGSAVAAPLAKEIFEGIIAVKNIAPAASE